MPRSLEKRLVLGLHSEAPRCGTSIRRLQAGEWPRCCRCSSATSLGPGWRSAGLSFPVTPSSSRSPSASTTVSTVCPATRPPYDAAAGAAYESVQIANARAITPQVRPDDVVILHDPQTAGLAAPLKAVGAVVLWRCHVGTEVHNYWTEEAWDFLRPHLATCDAFVFTRREYVPRWVPMDRVSIIPPSIDPFSPKNQELSERQRLQILTAMGVLGATPTEDATFTRRNGSVGLVGRRATVVAEGPLDASVPLVLQVSRWDHLKDMAGVMAGFVARVASRGNAQLALVGPTVDDVSDDPEGHEVLQECIEAWSTLPVQLRRQIRLMTLPMDDGDENAAMVNALQRHATIIVQKSLAEGFGLTVAEGMWKAKAVVASAVGGIVDQVVPGTGVLLDDPNDLDAFGDALVSLLDRPREALRLGEKARRHVLESFVGDEHLMNYGALMERLKAR